VALPNTITISSLATLMIQVPISARLNGSPNYNPTGDIVQLAFMAGDNKPTTPDWQTGSWAIDPGPEYLAQCLVGPTGTVTLAVGTWSIWVKVLDNPETPVLPDVGTLIVD
jgi:hypothetical protein